MVSIQLHKGDCLEIMPSISDNSIDMILCDLPYGTTKCKWDKIIPLDLLWKQYNRIVKNNGAIVLFSQMPFTFKLYNSQPKLFRYEWIWDKNIGTGFLNAKKMPLKRHENILVFYKKLPTYNPQFEYGYKSYAKKSSTDGQIYREGIAGHFSTSDGCRYPKDILNFTNHNGKLWGKDADEVAFHSTHKPIPLLEYLIKTYTNEGETVLDNCMGSGSTGVACVNTNRNFIGIEKDDRFFEIAEYRIKNNQTDKPHSANAITGQISFFTE